MRVIEIITEGPQGPTGPQGPEGPIGSIDTGSLVTTGSNSFIGNQTILGYVSASSFTGSLYGTSSWSSNAITASFAATTPVSSKTFTGAEDSAAVSGVGITYITSSLIPANTFAAGDYLDVTAQFRKIGTFGTASFRLYTNTADSLTGATLVGTAINTNTSALRTELIRTYVVKTTDGTGQGTMTALASLTLFQPFNQITNSTNLAIDWTINQYLIFTVQHQSANDTSLLVGYKIRP